MKKIAFLLFSLVLLAACDKTTNKYYMCEPVYTDTVTFRTPAQFEAPRSIKKDGRIYFKDDYLFVVEPNEGIHFINNSDPSNPVVEGFLNVMGASGLSIRDNYLYITALVDLVIVDVSNISAPFEVGRFKETFPTALPLMDKNYPTATIDKNKGIVTSWNVVKVKETDDFNSSPQWVGCFNCMTLNSFEQSTGSGSSATGIAGSFAMMTIVNDYLYVIDQNQLRPFDITNRLNPTEGTASYLGWTVETIFPTDDYLYMGTTTGMMIYNTDNPSSPQFEGSISHARACDPVVVQGDYAYVTVRSGGSCGGNINQMDVVNVADKSNPYIVETVKLKNPHGVGVDGTTLFVCDGSAGLKIYDVSNPSEVDDNLIKQFKNIEATDVIPFNNVAMVIGEDGIYQYDYTDNQELKLLSKIKF